jgi:hypothetical protein
MDLLLQPLPYSGWACGDNCYYNVETNKCILCDKWYLESLDNKKCTKIPCERRDLPCYEAGDSPSQPCLIQPTETGGCDRSCPPHYSSTENHVCELIKCDERKVYFIICVHLKFFYD